MDGEMYHTVELVRNIELYPWFSQKIIDMMAWFGFELGKGLWDELQGIVEPIHPFRHSTTIGFDISTLPKNGSIRNHLEMGTTIH